ncbi:MAG TPA: hypothetical protein VF855_00375, partial [Acidimicrobiales bacterium]
DIAEPASTRHTVVRRVADRLPRNPVLSGVRAHPGDEGHLGPRRYRSLPAGEARQTINRIAADLFDTSPVGAVG